MKDLEEIWKETRLMLKEEVSDVSFKTWIDPIHPASIDHDTITLEVPYSINKNMIFTKYYSLIESSIEIAANNHFQIEVVVTEEETAKEDEDLENINIFNPRYTFDTFIVGNNNNLAYAAAMAVAESPAKTYNPLFLYGGSGLGKTHLLHAIANFIHQNNSKYKRIMYMTSEKFTNELVSSIKTETNDAFREKYRRVDLLLVDDIQFLAGRERTQEEFFHTFNVLYDSEKQIVLTSDRLPSEIPQLEERLRTRFSMGLIADVQPPDYETRVAILRNKIENEYLSIDDEILEYVAENVKSNVRDLEGAVKRMLAYAGIHRTKKVTMGLAMQALKDIADSTPKREITVKLIIEIVEKYYRVSRGSLVSHKRSKDLTFPRQVAMYIARELTNESLPAIGQEFDGRDHTTVMHAINKIKSEMQTNEELKVAIDEIITNVNRN